jgi:hypothetical protein
MANEQLAKFSEAELKAMVLDRIDTIETLRQEVLLLRQEIQDRKKETPQARTVEGEVVA